MSGLFAALPGVPTVFPDFGTLVFFFWLEERSQTCWNDLQRFKPRQLSSALTNSQDLQCQLYHDIVITEAELVSRYA